MPPKNAPKAPSLETRIERKMKYYSNKDVLKQMAADGTIDEKERKILEELGITTSQDAESGYGYKKGGMVSKRKKKIKMAGRIAKRGYGKARK